MGWRAAVREKKDASDAPQKEILVIGAKPQKAKIAGIAGADQEVAPKNFLASERTMLEWMHTVVALAFLGIGLWRVSLTNNGVHKPVAGGLLNGASSSATMLGIYSLVLIATALGFAWYAVLSHTKRLKALFQGPNAHTEHMFNTRKAPIAFACTIGVALSSHLAVQIVPMWLALGEDSDESTFNGTTSN